MKSAWQLTSRPVTEGPEAPENGLWRCRGSWWAQSPRCPHICNVLMQKSTSLRLPSSEETAPLKSLSPPHSSETLDSPPPPLSQHWLWPYEKPPKQSALIWLSEWLLNWEYLVLGFLDAGWKGASHFSARSRISLRGLTLTEADSLPVRLQGAEGLGSNKTLREKHQASNERGENPGRTFQFPSYQNHALYVKLSNLSAWAICPFK